MNGEWHSSRPNGWPRRGRRLGAVLLGLLAMPAAWFLEVQYQWGGLERHYLPQYIRSGLLDSKAGKYHILEMIDSKGKQRPAIALEVEAAPGPTPRGYLPLRLTQAAIAAGSVRLVDIEKPVDSHAWHNFMEQFVYDKKSLRDLAQPGMLWGVGVMVVGLFLAWPLDRRAQRILDHGRRVRGAELVTRHQFNRKRKYRIGIGFLTKEPRSVHERMWIRYPDGPMIAIPQEDEPKHFLLMGDTGTGKSALIRQILWQLTKQKQTAIVYDPAREYVERFYNPERGDIILNPLDARAPFWNPGEELEHDAEARTIAESVFPDQPNEPPFFTHTPRKIFAQMLRARMNAEEMVEMMCDGAALDRLVEGTEMASMISQAAPSQREGVRASLNLVADALRLLKTKDEAALSKSGTWTAREWSRTRRGWIFLTSTPELRAPLQPLLSLWLDLLVLRLMNQEAQPSRVWFVLDELASLQKLPQLATALTENRKSNNPVVAGIQGKAQMETLYGHMAEAMLSQPWTKIFLKTSEPRAAKWISDAIGEQDREWLRESRTEASFFSPGARETKTYMVEKRTVPVVLPSEIGGLPALHGYLKNGNDVVKMSFPYMQFPKAQPGYIEREWKAARKTPARATNEARGGKTQKLEKVHQQQRGQSRGFFD